MANGNVINIPTIADEVDSSSSNITSSTSGILNITEEITRTSVWRSDMFLPTGQNVLFWRATSCGLPNITQNFLKMPKLTGKNWRFGDEKPNLVAPSNCIEN